MNNDLIQYIKTLSKEDTKTLSQKGLKAMEELGELARVLLPFDNAFATTHRFVDRDKILEEIADSYLTIMSIAYDLNYTEDEIESMISKKADKWAGLINKEKGIKYPIPYEIHVTIQEIKKDVFHSMCEHLNVKPIILELQNNKSVFTDVMTSSRHYGDNRSAYEEMKRISNTINSFAGKVIREKIETAIWHPAAPQSSNDIMPKNCYFECHIGTIANNINVDKIKIIAENTQSHLSKNIFKNIDSNNYILMLTYRTYTDNRELFENRVKEIIKLLEIGNIQYKNVTKEFSIYDTKVSHDASWLNN